MDKKFAVTRQLPAHNAKRLSVKPERARKSVLTILFCLMLLVISSQMLSTGLDGVMMVFKDGLGEAEQYLEVLQGKADNKHRVGHRLGQLVATNLPGRMFETQPECLARGINHAHVHFRGQGYFEYPEVRNQTMEWVKDNCDTLLFTPQVATPQPYSSPRAAWARLSYRAKIAVELLKLNVVDPMGLKVIKPMKHRLLSATKWIRLAIRGERPVETNVTPKEPFEKPQKLPWEHLYLPRHFQLIGRNDGRSCSLVYIPPANTLEPAETSNEDELQLVMHTTMAMHAILQKALQAYRIIQVPLIGGLLLQAIFGYALLIIEYYHPTPRATHWSSLPASLKQLYIGIAAQGAITTLLFKHKLAFAHLPPGVYTWLLALGLIGYTIFLVPRYTKNTTLPTLFQLVFAVVELYHALKAPLEDEKLKAPISVPLPPSPVLSRTKPDGPSISPTTSLQEDIEAVRADAREKRGVEDATTDMNDESLFLDARAEPGPEAKSAVFEDVDLHSGSDSSSDWSVVNRT